MDGWKMAVGFEGRVFGEGEGFRGRGRGWRLLKGRGVDMG